MGQISSIIHKFQLFMILRDMQSSSGNYSMRYQVPMVFLLLLVSAAYISEEINLGLRWRRDIAIFKGHRSSTNHKMLLFVSWSNKS